MRIKHLISDQLFPEILLGTRDPNNIRNQLLKKLKEKTEDTIFAIFKGCVSSWMNSERKIYYFSNPFFKHLVHTLPTISNEYLPKENLSFFMQMPKGTYIDPLNEGYQFNGCFVKGPSG